MQCDDRGIRHLTEDAGNFVIPGDNLPRVHLLSPHDDRFDLVGPAVALGIGTLGSGSVLGCLGRCSILFPTFSRMHFMLPEHVLLEIPKLMEIFSTVGTIPNIFLLLEPPSWVSLLSPHHLS